MGTLVAWHYPTKLFMNLADHTYVACGNGGRAWSCWGGKSGGQPLRRGTGSTLRANAIAEPDEKANIRCYLVNGVCHQAANRILFPAGIIVRGAKGYWVSSALYGDYGRPRGFLGFCRSVFHQHPGVSGELPECEAGPPPGAPAALESPKAVEEGETSSMGSYLERVVEEYRVQGTDEAMAPLSESDDAMSFQLRLFDLMLEFKLESAEADSGDVEGLTEVRRDIEDERLRLEEEFFAREMPVAVFVQSYNGLIVRYQETSAETAGEQTYREVFEVPPEEPVTLGDPDVAIQAYGDSYYGG